MPDRKRTLAAVPYVVVLVVVAVVVAVAAASPGARFAWLHP